MKIFRSIVIVQLFFCVFINDLTAQAIYHTGNTENVETNHLPGILLVGGRSEYENPMKWFLQRSDGGDIVVLRADDSDYYNDYFYNELEIEVNSVTTIVISTSEHADEDAVEQIVLNAEAIYIVGDNQWGLINNWKGTKLLDALNHVINEKEITIGGHGAGMAMLGEVLFTMEAGAISSTVALSNPFHSRITLDDDFLSIPFMENTITESNYNQPGTDDLSRKGRHITFLARMVTDWQLPAKGIGVNEYTAVAIDEAGTAKVFGDPDFFDYAYFLQAYGGDPEICEDGEPLTWDLEGTAVKVYKVKGELNGMNTFSLADWDTGTGGIWEYWFVVEGEMFEEEIIISINDIYGDGHYVNIFPNPADDMLYAEILKTEELESIRIICMQGKVQFEDKYSKSTNVTTIDVSSFNAGLYFIQFNFKGSSLTRKWIKR